MGGGEPRSERPDGSASDRATDGAVLVVDDEPLVCAWIARVLDLAGIATVTAGSGREALRLVASGRVRPAVLLTDIEMPGMTGIELAARIRALRPAVRIVMMTGDPVRAEAARARSSIVATVLLKPIPTAELLAALRPDTTPVAS